MALINQIEVADDRLRPHVLETPLIPAPSLGTGTQLKLENLQHTGSFKARGALNRILERDRIQPHRESSPASTGQSCLGRSLGCEPGIGQGCPDCGTNINHGHQEIEISIPER